tara:strand:- start:14 stop:1003 length:990 start_codon:yes stop_codon:yes gene_type:complete
MRILIVGLGSIGSRHLTNILSTTNNEIIVYTKRTRLDFKIRKNIEIFHDLESCIAKKPDVAFITNETAFHIPIAKKLARLGLDLFIEKPLSNTLKNIKNTVDISKRKKLITLMGCNLRFNSSIKKIKSLIEEKKIGKIISVKVECGTYLPDWHPNEDYTKGYAARDDLGGGVVLTCIHEIDYLYWFFGEIDEVFSITGKFSDLKIRASDLSAVILRFKNNIIAEIHLDYFQKPDTRSCKIIGTKGTIEWDSNSNEVRMYNVKKLEWISKLKIKKYNKNEAYLRELKYFFWCVNNRKKTMNDISDGEYVLRVALGIIRSSKLKKMIKIKK